MIHSVSIHHFSLSTQDTPVTIAYPDMPLAQLSQDGVEPPTSLTNQQLQPRQAVWQEMFGLSPKSSQLRILSRTPVGTGNTFCYSKYPLIKSLLAVVEVS